MNLMQKVDIILNLFSPEGRKGRHDLAHITLTNSYREERKTDLTIPWIQRAP